MKNFIAFNNTPSDLKLAIYGTTSGGELKPFSSDSSGKLIISSSLTETVVANSLDIRNISSITDSIAVTATTLNIRNLNGTQDSVKVYNRNFVEDSDSGTIVALGTRIFLSKNIGSYKNNIYLVRNTGGVAVTITLQVAPIDSEAYYVDDGTGFSLLAGGSRLFKPSILMKYARIKVTAVLLGSVTVNYFGQS
ncbi:DUF6385 domain-containing protein [Clostridium hydrogeniformans]|uniref:DUF6385 domain-containing protein n=1 Tax=Clostridium hydrogeniformans TaxID=349933 RepID=UPI00047F85C6|nr:DUF6385 domain-containing protein [Clostridium hydrogeniformans]